MQMQTSNLSAEVTEQKNAPDTFSVEAFGEDGECYVTIFSGPNAKRLAAEYATAKYHRVEVTMKTIDGARVHRFGDLVAVSIKEDDGYTKTIYIDPSVAEDFLVLLNNVVDDINERKFVQSKVGTWTVKRSGVSFHGTVFSVVAKEGS